MRGLAEIDRILRGAVTSAPDFRERGLTFQLGQVILANILLAALSGVCLGVFGLANRQEPEYRFMLADAIKVPLLFTLSLAVTFPSLYVFNALVGSPLGVAQIGRLMTAALAVLLAVLAAFGPVVAFFSVSSTSYPFILLLNVVIFTVAGGFGIDFLWRMMVKLTARAVPPRAATSPIARPPQPAVPVSIEDLEEVQRISPTVPDRAVITVFQIWLVAFALVGMQMSWVLRPFIGTPGSDFAWFRPRDASFFEAVGRAVRALFFGA